MQRLRILRVPSTMTRHAEPADFKRVIVVSMRAFDYRVSSSAFFTSVRSSQGSVFDCLTNYLARPVRRLCSFRVRLLPSSDRFDGLFSMGDIPESVVVSMYLWILLRSPSRKLLFDSVRLVSTIPSVLSRPTGSTPLIHVSSFRDPEMIQTLRFAAVRARYGIRPEGIIDTHRGTSFSVVSGPVCCLTNDGASLRQLYHFYECHSEWQTPGAAA